MTRKRRTDMFGTLTGPNDITLQDLDALTTTEHTGQQPLEDMADSPLWEYMNTGRINGIPVSRTDLGLKLDSDAMVQAAFQLERSPKSMLLYMSPDDEDSAAKYDGIMAKAYAGEVLLVDEQKQFDASRGKFIVWLRYDEVQYALHPRFQYLREE